MTSPSPVESAAAQRAMAFFEGLSRDSMHLVDEFYADDVRFEDPMVILEGRARMRAYYESIYRNDPSLRWEFTDVIGDDRRLALGWIMHLEVAGLNGGRPFAVPGLSRLHFEARGRCVFHRDYFDMGAFVYERLPVLRNVIGLVKRKLHGSEFDAA